MAYEESSERLALSRADGSIEIWNCSYKPYLYHVIGGDEESSVEALVWCNRRLFSAGLHGFILEYDLSTLQPKLHTAVTGGPTWCLALSPDKNKLAAGTEEGYVCLFDITEEGLLYDRTLEKQDGRILNIAWHKSGDYVVTGSVDFIRLWSLDKGQVTRFPVGRDSRNKETIVWCVAILDNMTIVSGDSRGKTSFWDGKLGTLLDSVQTHKAHVQCLQVAPNQRSVYVAGVDPDIVEVNFVETGSKSGRKHRWIKSVSRRIHTHDVRCLILTGENKLFSGGVDTYLAMSHYPPKVCIKYPALPQPGFVSVASEAESVLLRHDKKVELWRLGSFNRDNAPPGNGVYLPLSQDMVKMLTLECKSNEVIEGCAISPDALWLAYLVQGSLRLFRFYPPQPGSPISVHRIREISSDIETSSQIMWLGEGMLASATRAGSIQIITVTEKEAKLHKNLLLKDGHNVRLMATNHDISTIVVADDHESVVAFNLDTGSQITLPHYKAPITAIGINSVTNNVVVACSDLMILEYSLTLKKYTDCGRHLMNNLPHEWIKRHSTIHHISFDPKRPNIIILHDDNSIIFLDKNKTDRDTIEKASKMTRFDPSYENSSSSSGGGPQNNVTKISSGSGQSLFSIIRRPNHVLHFSHLKNEYTVSVEFNPLNLLDKLPPVLKKEKFGTK